MSFLKRNTWGWREEDCTIRIQKNLVRSRCVDHESRVIEQRREKQEKQMYSVSWGHRVAQNSQTPFGVLTQCAWTLDLWKPMLRPRQRLMKPQMNKGFSFHMQLQLAKNFPPWQLQLSGGHLQAKKQEDLTGYLCFHFVCRLFFKGDYVGPGICRFAQESCFIFHRPFKQESCAYYLLMTLFL